MRFKWIVWCCVQSHYCTLNVHFQLCIAGTPQLCLYGASYPEDVFVSHQYHTEPMCPESGAQGSVNLRFSMHSYCVCPVLSQSSL